METQPVEYLRSGKNFCVPPSFQSVSYWSLLQGVEVARPPAGDGWQRACYHGRLHHLHLPAHGDQIKDMADSCFKRITVSRNLSLSNLQMAQSLGFSLAHASLLISVVGVTNTLGRIFSGWITDLPSFRWEVLNIVPPCINICLLCQRPRGDNHRHWDLLHLPGDDASRQLLPNPRRHQVTINIMIINIVIINIMI